MSLALRFASAARRAVPRGCSAQLLSTSSSSSSSFSGHRPAAFGTSPNPLVLRQPPQQLLRRRFGSATITTTAPGGHQFRAFSSFAADPSYGSSGQRHQLSPAEIHQLRRLEQLADDRPGDAGAQLRLMRAALGAHLPELVVARAESGQFARSPEVDAAVREARDRLRGNSPQQHHQQQQQPQQPVYQYQQPQYQYQPPPQGAPAGGFSPWHSSPVSVAGGHSFEWTTNSHYHGGHNNSGHSFGGNYGRSSSSSSGSGDQAAERASEALERLVQLYAEKNPTPSRFLTLANRIINGVLLVSVGVFLWRFGGFFGGVGDGPLSGGAVGGDGEGDHKPSGLSRLFRGMGMNNTPYELDMSKNPVTFADVVGIDECRDEVMELVAFLKNPQEFASFGGRMPAGLLLSGPPGTGKTLLAKAMAGEAGVPILYTAGSSFEEMFVGVGASRVRALFEEARQKAPCVVFIDEIDGIGGRRRGVSDSTNGSLMQLLAEVDGFRGTEGIVVVAATNRPDQLDEALTRPGRFDKRIEVPLPDLKGRASILRSYLKKIKLAEPVNALELARTTVGFSGAQLANLVNLSAVTAANRRFLKDERDVTGVSRRDVEEAKERITMGLARTSVQVSEEDRRLTAYHEGGHTLAALLTQDSRALHKVSILPRGPAGGVTHFQLEKDENYKTRAQLRADLIVAMGGRCAEILIYGDERVTTGPGSDLQQATRIARAMVTQLGMGSRTGLQVFNDPSETSPDAARLIDEEVRHILQEAHDEAKRLLEQNMDQLHRLANALLEYETLTADEVRQVLRGEKLNRVI